MSKDNLLDHAVQATGLSRKDVDIAWKALQAAIHMELKDGQEVSIAGVGKLKPAIRPARTGRNPQTGATLEIPEKATVKLAVSKTYTD